MSAANKKADALGKSADGQYFNQQLERNTAGWRGTCAPERIAMQNGRFRNSVGELIEAALASRRGRSS